MNIFAKKTRPAEMIHSEASSPRSISNDTLRKQFLCMLDILRKIMIQVTAFMISLDYILEAFGARLARRESGLSPQQNIFTDRAKAVLLLWIICVI